MTTNTNIPQPIHITRDGRDDWQANVPMRLKYWFLTFSEWFESKY